MDIDTLINQSIHKVVVSGCMLCNPPDSAEGFDRYVAKLEEIETSQPGRVNRSGVFRTMKSEWDLPIAKNTVDRHFAEHCGH